MASVSGVGRTAIGVGNPARTSPAGSGFTLPADVTAAAEAPGAAAPASLAAMLSVQEAASEKPRDRAARRHGEALLRLLAALQRGILAGEAGGDTAAALAALLRELPEAADPALRGVVAAIALRARLELARTQSSQGRNGAMAAR